MNFEMISEIDEIEVLARGSESQGTTLEDLATKSGLKTLEMKLYGEIRLMKWMIGFVLAGIAALVLKFFFA